MRRWIAGGVAALLMLSVIPSVSAASYNDTAGHWAESYIDQATQLGLFNGYDNGGFGPDDQMTRAMFIKVLGKAADVDPAQWPTDNLSNIFQDVNANSYYAPYLSWAVHMGIAKGTGTGAFSPDMPVTREQAATFISAMLNALGMDLPETNADTTFTDSEDISPWATNSAQRLAGGGVIQGIPAAGGVSFQPQKITTRAEAATMFLRVAEKQQPVQDWEPMLPTEITLSQNTLTMNKGDTVTLTASVSPISATNQTVVWYSTNQDVATVSLQGVVHCTGFGTAMIVAETSNGLRAYCEVSGNVPGLVVPLYYADKCMLVFGEVVDDPRLVYTTTAESQAQMTTIKINVWDLASNGSKYTRQFSLTIHKNIAPIVAAIFEEIYNLPEKPPIHSIGGYRANAGKSEHTPGLAIDINANENYYCDSDGTAITGSFFDPERSEYSIPVGGSIDKIFAKYGFTRGIYWNSGKKDYMHYSYFGT